MTIAHFHPFRLTISNLSTPNTRVPHEQKICLVFPYVVA